ncbi:MAG: helix-hairpin-helix domain-containing protein [Acidimicrobiales bacterium]
MADWWSGWRDRLPHRPALAGIAVAGVVLVLLAVLILRPPAGATPQLTLPVAGADGTVPPAAAPTPPSTAAVTVHAAGAVANPGVYAVPAGSRVADVLAAAGGPVAEADLDRVNLAVRVNDGDRVHLARKGEATAGEVGAAPPASAKPGPVDLNAATADALDALPGIGPATAQAILTYRNRHGRFRSVNELLEVPGIGPSKLETVRPLVKV